MYEKERKLYVKTKWWGEENRDRQKGLVWCLCVASIYMARQCVNKCTCFKRTLNPPLGISHHTGDRRWSSHSGRVNIETRIWSCCCCCCYCCCLKYTQPVYLQKLQYRSSQLALPPPRFIFLSSLSCFISLPKGSPQRINNTRDCINCSF